MSLLVSSSLKCKPVRAEFNLDLFHYKVNESLQGLLFSRM